MSLIVLMSLLLRMLAVAWSCALWVRHKDRRWLLLSVLVLALAAAQWWSVLAEPSGVFAGGSGNSWYLAVLNLLVSVLALGFVGSLALSGPGSSEPVRDSNYPCHNREQLLFTQFSVDSCSSAIFWIREDASFFFVNQAAARNFGYSRSELLQMSVHDIDPAYPPAVWPDYWKHLKQERSLTFNTRMRHKTGKTIPVEITTNLLEFDGQEFVFAFVNDISERKQAEESLRESEANLSALIENSTDSILSVDRNYRVLTANSVVRTVARDAWGNDIRPGHNILEQVPGDDAVAWKKRYDRALAGERFTVEQQYDLDGRVQTHEVSFNPIVSNGTVSGVSVFARDITGRLNAEQALNESEGRVRLAFDQQFQFMAILSPEGRVLEINDLPLQIQGAAREQFVGKYFWETPAWDSLPRWQAIIRSRVEQARTADGPVLVEDLYQTTAGELRFADSAYSAMRDPDGRIRFLLVQATDVTERKRAQQALKESEERWQFALESSRDGVWDWNAETNRVYFSRRWKEMLGYQDDDLSGHLDDWEQRLHPEDKEQCLADLKRHLDGKSQFYENEHRVQCKDGSWKWVLDRGKVIARRDNGHPQRVIGTHTDITARKQAEKALRQSEQLFRSLVETAPFGVQRIDTEGRITFANAALGKIYECEPNQLVGKSIWDLAIDEQSCLVMRRYLDRQLVQPHPVPTVIESKNLTCNNRAIDVYIDWTYEFDPDNRVIGFIAIVTDITGRRASERALEFQADVLNRVSDAVMVTDASGAITYANAAAKQLFRVTWKASSDRTLQELHDEFLASGSASREIRLGLTRTGMWQGENEFRFGNTTRTFELKLNLFEPHGAERRYLLSVARDATARKNADEELRQHRQMLAHVTRLSTMGEMLAGVAHEIKQPLHAIANFATATSVTLDRATLTKVDDESLTELKEWNRGIRDSSRRAGEIIRRLREFARKGEYRRETVNVNRVINDSIDLVAFEARQCHAIVETGLAIDLPNVDADRIQCEQVVVNLLHNACEALISAELPRQIFVRSRKIEGFVEIEIEDNGPGIQTEQQGQLFEAFYTTKPEGLGMGLAISQTIIEDHGGRLWASRNRQRGTTFHFTLPVKPDTVHHGEHES